MKSAKVRLYIRIRRADGKDAYVDPVWNRNRTLRGGYAEVGGAPEHHAEGIYYLRYKAGGNPRRWVHVGGDPDLALVALHNTEHDLQAICLGREARDRPSAQTSLTTPAAEGAELSLDGEIEAYLDEVRKLKHPDGSDRIRSVRNIGYCYVAGTRSGGAL